MGIDARGTTSARIGDLRNEFAQGRSIGVGITSDSGTTSGHWAYVSDMDDQGVSLFDPNKKTPWQRRMSWEEFKPRFNPGGAGGYIVSAPGRPAPVGSTAGSATPSAPVASVLNENAARWAQAISHNKFEGANYNTKFGGGTFDNTRPHPGGMTPHGRYQFQGPTWVDAHGGQNLPMTPENQDRAFLKLGLRRRVNFLTDAPNEASIRKLRNEWTSVPGADESRFGMADFLKAFNAGSPSVGQTVAAAGGTVAASTANQAEALQQSIQDLSSQDSRLSKAIEDLTQWLQGLGNIQALQQENLTEQQLAERFELEYQRRKTMLTAEVLQTPQGRLGVATGDAVSGSISSTISGSLQALLTGGDVKAAVSSALAQAGQSLMQATLDALLNPLLAQLQSGIVKAVTGIDIQGRAQELAAASLTNAAGAQQGAALQLTTAAQAQMAAAGLNGPNAVAQGVGILDTLASVLPSAISGFAGLGSFMAPAGAFDIATSLMDFAAAPNLVSGVGGFIPPTGAFTPGLAGGGEIQYGLDYLVGEKNAEIVRFNKAGGKVYSNRALTKALGVPFQRSPGGGAAVAEGGGDSMGSNGISPIPFSSKGSNGVPPIPFLKASSGGGGGGLMGAGTGGASPGDDMGHTRPLKINVDTQVINGVEYATVQQLREAAAAAAQAGRDSVAYDMRNSPTFQRSVGLG
jgi:hypothetical protein